MVNGKESKANKPKVKKNAPKPLVPKPAFVEKKRIDQVGICDSCGPKPLDTVVDGTFNFNAFKSYATHIAFKINERRGTVFKAGDAVVPGTIYLYLLRLFTSYSARCGAYTGDASFLSNYESLFIPAYLGVIFHSSCVVDDGRSKGKVTIKIGDLPSSVDAETSTDGVWTALVVQGYINDEPFFSSGAGPHSMAYLTDDKCRLISTRIQSAFPEVVRISDIAVSTSSWSAFYGADDTGIKPLSSFTMALMPVRVTARLIWTIFWGRSYSDHTSAEIYAALYLIEDCPYSANATLNSLCRSQKVDPFKFGVRFVPMNFPKWCQLVLNLLVESNALTSGSTADTGILYFGNFLAYFTCAFGARLSWVSRTPFDTITGFTGYITEKMKTASLSPAMAVNGGKPFIANHTLIVPYWNFAQNSQLMSLIQPSSSITPSSSSATNNLPITSSVYASYKIAKQTPIAANSGINYYPLNFFDDLYQDCRGYNSLIQDQCTLLSVDKPMCRCVCTCSLSDDTLKIGTGTPFVITWIETKQIATDILMDSLTCACAEGASLLDYEAYSRFFSLCSSYGGQSSERVTKAGLRESNYDQFAASRGKSGPDSIMRHFKEKMLATVDTELKRITGDQLVKLVQSAQDIGYVPVEVDPEMFRNLSGNYNLGWLVAAAAGAAARYGPGILQAIRGNRDVRVNVEL